MCSQFVLLLTALSLPIVAASLAGAPARKIVVVGGTHGNEYTGVWLVKALEKQKKKLSLAYPSLDIDTLLANPQAHIENKRFVHEDLNRRFSHEALSHAKNTRTAESMRAQELDKLLGPKFSDEYSTDVIVDLHSTTTNMGLTLIIAEGDPVMAAAAAYVIAKCGGEKAGVRCLMHTHANRRVRPNLSSIAKHGFTIEVGPVPQGVIRHDAVERTEHAVHAFLEFMERRNQVGERGKLEHELKSAYNGRGVVPCFRSAPAVQPGEMSGKISWPSDPENPNFPTLMIHKNLQDRDFELIRTGDPLFVDLDGNEILYAGSHGDAVYLIFINEAGYYYSSSGTGVSVALRATFDIESGKLLEEDQRVLEEL